MKFETRRERELRRKRQKRSAILGMVFAILVVIGLGILLWNGKKNIEAKNVEYEKEISQLQAQVDSEQKRTDELNEYKKYIQTKKFVEEVAKDYPEVTLTHMLVDNCAMQLVMNPGQFDVILTENMFGDILSDEASMITGSIGMLSSASLNEGKFGLYEPSHGSAPDIAGKDIANPIATILSAAMMLRYSFDLDKEAKAIEDAVQQVLTEGYRTVDIMADGCKQVGTVEMGRLICERIR